MLANIYSELFGWSVNSDNLANDGVFDPQSGAVGINGRIMGGDRQQPRVSVYAEVDDPQAALDKAASLGASVVVPVTEAPGKATFALFADPEGNLDGVVHHA